MTYSTFQPVDTCRWEAKIYVGDTSYLTGVKHYWMEGEDYLQGWQISYYYTQCDRIHSFRNLWIIFVQVASIQNHNVWLKCINAPHSHLRHESCQRKPYNSPCNINSTLELHCCTHSSNVLMNVLWMIVN